MNVSMDIKRRELMNSYKEFLSTLSLRNKGNDPIFLATKVTILSWWSSKTKMSLNCKEVVKN